MCAQYDRMPSIHMLKLSFAIISPIWVAPPFEQILITHKPKNFCVQYLRILLSSFGEEDFQRFASNFLCLNCLWLLFRQQCICRHHLNKLE